jgi:acyl-CoA synthetase (AMP-forming)/AMP-acid ligase II
LNQNQASLVVAPLSHGAGIHALVNVARGVPSVLLSSQSLNELECFELIQAYKISNLFTVPTILKRLADHPLAAHHDLSSLRQVIYAGAPISRVDQLQALKVLGPVIVQYFGLGEVTGNITVLTTDEHLQEEGALLSTCGSARTGMEVAILDEQGTVLSDFEIGEICTRGPAVFAGYWHNPEANEKVFRGGWFHTGDLGFMNERGYLTITGRASDMYITGGSNVYPREVEEALSSLPGVSQVVVFGIEDKEWGESGVAVLVVSPQDSAPSLEDLYAHLSSRLAKYKWPKHFAFWGHIPTSAYGKLVKKDIRDRYLRENAK